MENFDDLGSDLILKTSVKNIAKTFSKYKSIMLDIEATNQFLGVDPSEQFKLDQMYPVFMSGMVIQSLYKYLEENGFKILMEKNYRYGEKESPVEYRDTTISRGVSKNLIAMGYLYVENNLGYKAVFVVDFINYGRVGKLEVVYKKENNGFFSNVINTIDSNINEFDYFKGEKISIGGRLLEINNYDWKDIVLEDGIREAIDSNIIYFFNKRDIYEKNGVPFKRGVFLKGPPGTGKTLIGKILANKVENVTFILATAADIEDASDVRNLFSMARKYSPSIIFLEDADFFAQNRIDGHYSRITGELLNQLDGIEDNNGIVVVATTNHPEALDEAIVHRPGRFDVILDIGKLSLDNRYVLLTRNLNRRQKTEDVDLYDIAKRCEGFTGSHIKELANSVCMLAINYNSLDDNGYIILLNEHFDEAIAKIKEHCNIYDEGLKTCCEVDKPISIDEPSCEKYSSGFNGYLFKKEEN